ncbi:hypothetical protein AVEN_267514-1, partial [Araneus ventricosus]
DHGALKCPIFRGTPNGVERSSRECTAQALSASAAPNGVERCSRECPT